jgi:hypothetical protein
MKLLEHASYGMHLCNETIGALWLQELEILSQENLAFEFGKRSRTDSDEASQLDISLTATAFCQVSRYRHCGAAHLRAKPIPLLGGKSAGRPVNRGDQLLTSARAPAFESLPMPASAL